MADNFEEELFLDSGSVSEFVIGDANEAAILDEDFPFDEYENLERDNISTNDSRDNVLLHDSNEAQEPAEGTSKLGIMDIEELDYDEDTDLNAESTFRTGKFSSERALMRQISNSNKKDVGSDRRSSVERKKNAVEIKTKSPRYRTVSTRNTRVNTTAKIPKVLINPHYKGIIQSDAFAEWSPKVGGVQNSLPTASSNIAFTPQQCSSDVPQIPHLQMDLNTFSSSNAQMMNFSQPPPVYPNFSVPPPVFYQNPLSDSIVQPQLQWNDLVEGFLRRTNLQPRPKRYSRSPSLSSYSRSRSRTYSSRSPTSGSSYTRSSSSSSHHSGRNNSRHLSSRRREMSNRRKSITFNKKGLNAPTFNRKVLNAPSSHSKLISNDKYENKAQVDRRVSTSANPALEKRIECAKAIGLDNDYLKKLEEQKRKREEIWKKKEERRFLSLRGANTNSVHENLGEMKTVKKVDSVSSSAKSSIPPRNNFVIARQSIAAKERNPGMSQSREILDSSRIVLQTNKERYKDQVLSQKRVITSPSSTQNKTEKSASLKAYLAVIVKTNANSKINLDKIQELASTIGKVKSAWPSGKSIVVIFDNRECAKKFVLRCGGRSINGVQLHLTLEKVYAKLDTNIQP